MIDKVFHDVARQIDWDAGAVVVATRAFRSLGFSVPENASDLTLERIAALNKFDQHELRFEFSRKLQAEILERLRDGAGVSARDAAAVSRPSR